jgi:spore maturation protein CgeB
MSMASSLRVLLVAKPWRGGLGAYVHAALCELVGADRVSMVATRPQTLPEALARRRNRRAWDAALIARIERQTYDVALFIQPPPCVAQLGNAHKHIHWVVDDVAPHGLFLPSMGHVFIADPGYLPEAQALIPPAQFAGVLPFAMLPSQHHPGIAAAKQQTMCFIGNRDPKRSQWLASLFAHAMDVHIYGNYFLRDPLWRAHPLRFHPSVSRTAMQQVYARHRLSLNLHAGVVRGGTNMRSFEAAGYGIAQLVEHRPGIDALFDTRREITCFTTAEEAKAGYDRLLGDPAHAQTLAKNAAARVLAEHTYAHRVRTMLARV